MISQVADEHERSSVDMKCLIRHRLCLVAPTKASRQTAGGMLTKRYDEDLNRTEVQLAT